jgi:hypothetical protein
LLIDLNRISKGQGIMFDDSTLIVPCLDQGANKKFNRHFKRLNQVFSGVIIGRPLTVGTMTGSRADEAKRERKRRASTRQGKLC